MMTKLYLIFSAAVAALFMTLPIPQEPAQAPSAPAQVSAPTTAVTIPPISPGQNPARTLFGSTQNVNNITVAGFYEQRPGEMSQAMQTYRDANSDEDKAKARDEIKVQLAKQYDDLLANQDHQIKELEDRIAKLKDQLSRRRDAKEKMVNLKLEMVLSQADGLGWPDNDHSARFLATISFPQASQIGVMQLQHPPWMIDIVRTGYAKTVGPETNNTEKTGIGLRSISSKPRAILPVAFFVCVRHDAERHRLTLATGKRKRTRK